MRHSAGKSTFYHVKFNAINLPQLITCVLGFVGPSDEDQFVGQEWLLQTPPHWGPWEDEAICVCLDVRAWSREKPVLQRHLQRRIPSAPPSWSEIELANEQNCFYCWLVGLTVPDETNRDQWHPGRICKRHHVNRIDGKGIHLSLSFNFHFFLFGGIY